MGRIGLSTAIHYFTVRCYTVSLPLNDTQWYDMIVEKDGVFQTVQCKMTNTYNREVSLKQCGGTNGGVYDTILNHKEHLDLLFCVDRDLNVWIIPIEDIVEAGLCTRILLRKKEDAACRGFQTQQYHKGECK